MQTTTATKSRTKDNQTNDKNDTPNAENSEKNAETEDAKKDEPKKPKKVTEDIQKLFLTSMDPYDVPLKWWEKEHVKYAINYPLVKSRLERIMGSHIVRLTDRKYMTQLSLNIARDYEEQQKVRIEGRKLPPPSTIARLMEISEKALAERIKQQKRQKMKLYV